MRQGCHLAPYLFQFVGEAFSAFLIFRMFQVLLLIGINKWDFGLGDEYGDMQQNDEDLLVSVKQIIQ